MASTRFLILLLMTLPIYPAFATQSQFSYDAPVRLYEPVLYIDSSELDSIRAGDQVVIATSIRHNYDFYYNQPFVVIFDVRDNNSTSVHISWVSGDLDVEDNVIAIGVSWIPEMAGDYSLRTFAISDFERPNVLSEVYASEVTIDRRQG